MSKTYSHRTCRVCHTDITASGAGFVAHMRKHVKNKECFEVLYMDEHYNESRDYKLPKDLREEDRIRIPVPNTRRFLVGSVVGTPKLYPNDSYCVEVDTKEGSITIRNTP